MQEIELTDELKYDFFDYIINIDDRITSPNTIKSYGNVIYRIFKNYKVMNKTTIDEMVKKWRKSTKIKAVLSKMNEYFYHKDINFIIRLTKSKRSERRIPDIISRSELEETMKDMPPVVRLIISCIFNIGAGLRISELINLEWGDIDWNAWSLENKTITVKIRNSKRGKDRIVPIPHFTTAELYSYATDLGLLDDEGVPIGKKIFNFGSDTFKKELKLLEPEQWEYEYTLHSYDFIRHNIINRYFKNIKNKHITAHSLRHSRASELHNVYGIPIAKIQKWLGHSDIGTTMIYVHLATSEDTKMMEKIGGV